MLLRALTIALIALAAAAVPASAAWLPPADLAPPNPAGQPAGAPALAVARDGTGYVAFQRFDGANLRVAVVTRAPGGGFGAPVDLSPAGADAFSPAIAVDPAGNVTLAWMQAPTFGVHTRTKLAGGDWGETSPQLSLTGVQRGPSVAVAGNGLAVVVWGRATHDTVVRVEAAVRRSAQQTFGPALPASPDAGTGLCGTPRVTIDAAGNVAAIWTRRTSTLGDYHVESALRAAGAPAFAAFETRSTGAGNSSCNAEIAATPEGRLTAMWDFTETGSLSHVAFADRPPAGAWSTPVKLTTPGARVLKPTFALDDAGDTAATWLSADTMVSAVRPGLGAFAAPRPLSGATELSGVAVAAAGRDALTAFVGESNGDSAIFGSSRRGGGAFGVAEPVAPSAPGVILDSPDIDLDGEGNGLAVWQRRVGAVSSIRFAVFDPVPPVLVAAAVPASATAGEPVPMSAAATDRTSPPALRFDFGDGSGADGANVQHTYGAAGTYVVTVTATDAAGHRVSVTRTIVVAPAPVIVVPDTRPSRVFATTGATWDRLRNGRTKMLSLVVDELEGPELIKLTCVKRKQGCRKAATKTVKRHGRKVDLSKAVKGMVLRPGAKLTVTITRPNHVGRIYQYTMLRGKNPKKQTSCLDPGARRPRAC